MLSGCAKCQDGTEQARTGANTGGFKVGFKVGDRVRSKAPHYGEGGEEAVGTIVEASAYGMWRVVFPQPSTVAFCTVLEAHLTRVEETPAVQEASPFKVGDTVRVLKRNPRFTHPTDSIHAGRLARVVGLRGDHADADPIRVEYTYSSLGREGVTDAYPEDCLELVAAAPAAMPKIDNMVPPIYSARKEIAQLKSERDLARADADWMKVARDSARAAHANAVERATLESHNMMGVAARAERAEARVKVLEARAQDAARILEGR